MAFINLFRIVIPYKESEKQSKIHSKNEKTINESIAIICDLLKIETDDAEKSFIIKTSCENIKTNLNGDIILYAINMVVKGFKCIGYYYCDLLKKYINFNNNIYNNDFKYPIDMNEDFENLITSDNNNYKNIEINKNIMTDEFKYITEARRNKLLKAFVKYDRKALKYMINNINLIRSICNYKENSNSKFDYDIEAHLNKIWKELNGTYTLEVLFLPTNNNLTGRKYATFTSYQNIARKKSHTLAHQYYIDIDFINCHFCLLLNKCKQYNIDENKYK